MNQIINFLESNIIPKYLIVELKSYINILKPTSHVMHHQFNI
jgi:hypothetical protein